MPLSDDEKWLLTVISFSLPFLSGPRQTWPSATDVYDFDMAFRGAFARVKQEYDDGACVAIITNQDQKDPNSKRLVTWKQKMGHIARAIDCPLLVLAAISRDGFRKPGRLMWDHGIVQSYVEAGGRREDVEPLHGSGTFFVGDAAGRVGDHSDTDRKWATNVGVAFYTPEEYFLGEKVRSTPDARRCADCVTESLIILPF